MNKSIDSLSERFDQALHILMQNLGPHMISRAQLGLPPGQVIMLHLIDNAKLCSVSKLAEKMEVAPSAITVMLDRLENQGFVTRTRDKEDRRVVNIEITESGRAKLKQVLTVRRKILGNCFEKLNMHDLDTFIRTLEELASVAQTIDMKSIIETKNGEI